jgi:actin related protein 2/3 complex subunit 1A/1B
VELFPDNTHVLVGTTERNCRYYTVEESQAKTVGRDRNAKLEFYLRKFPVQGWVHCTAVSPSGEWIAFSSHDSLIRFINASEIETCEMMGFRGCRNAFFFGELPLRSIAFISDKALVGGGYDCRPRLFVLDGDAWLDFGLIDVPVAPGTGATDDSSVHDNVIVEIRVHQGLKIFSTCSHDGRIGIWPFEVIAKISLLKGKSIF